METPRQLFRGEASRSISEDEINMYVKVMKTLSLKVKRSETVKNLKTLLQEKEGISENLQELFFSGDWLKDSERLDDCGIQTDSTVYLVVQNLDTVKLVVKTASNQTIVVEARTNVTIQNLKSMIQAKLGFQSTQYSVVYDGMVLEDDRTLASLNLPSKPTFNLVSNPKDVLSISVKAPTGEIVKLKVKVLFTVRDVKAIVGSLLGDQVSDRNLFYAGKQLDDWKTLAFHDIKEGSILEMLPALIQIFVKTWSGKTITLGVQECNTIEDVKDKILQRLGMVKMPNHFQSLVYAGKRLEGDLDIKSYNIPKNATLHMVLSPSARIIEMRLTDIGSSIPDTTTICDLKAMIQEKTGNLVREVYFRKVALRDDRCLADYKIDENATIVVAI